MILVCVHSFMDNKKSFWVVLGIQGPVFKIYTVLYTKFIYTKFNRALKFPVACRFS